MSSENLNPGAFSHATDLKNRILFTIFLLIIYRLGTYIPLSGIDPEALKEVMKHYNKFLSLSRKHIKHSNENFSEEAVLPIYQALFNEIENNMGEIPIQQPLNLPTLNKMELPKLKTI